eukprot:scaffold69268_cov75-Phaeocystis_antarctica.AAC.6
MSRLRDGVSLGSNRGTLSCNGSSRGPENCMLFYSEYPAAPGNWSPTFRQRNHSAAHGGSLSCAAVSHARSSPSSARAPTVGMSSPPSHRPSAKTAASHDTARSSAASACGSRSKSACASTHGRRPFVVACVISLPTGLYQSLCSRASVAFMIDSSTRLDQPSRAPRPKPPIVPPRALSDAYLVEAAQPPPRELELARARRPTRGEELVSQRGRPRERPLLQVVAEGKYNELLAVQLHAEAARRRGGGALGSLRGYARWPHFVSAPHDGAWAAHGNGGEDGAAVPRVEQPELRQLRLERREEGSLAQGRVVLDGDGMLLPRRLAATGIAAAPPGGSAGSAGACACSGKSAGNSAKKQSCIPSGSTSGSSSCRPCCWSSSLRAFQPWPLSKLPRAVPPVLAMW